MRTFATILAVAAALVCAGPVRAQPCDHTITLYDSYGDGWNGGVVDVLVNGGTVLAGLTIASGAGPESHVFQAATGDAITTVYTAGSWSSENYYYIYDTNGIEICADGAGGTTPSGCSTAGNCEAPPAGGACCHADGSCTDEPDQATCEGASGVFQGGGSTCATTVCPSPNDDCANATVIGEVTGLAFSTSIATNDGGGTCMTSANLWYEYVPTCTGEAHVSLCGSAFDTKLGAYDGASCSPLGTEIGCNDDSPCSGRALQSELWLAVTQGSSYLLEVGAYGSGSGNGVITITCTSSGGGTCDHTITLYDSYGDGWNGGVVDVLVNGNTVLAGLTIASGAGPESHVFQAATGDAITTVYTEGGWGSENYYYIYDTNGQEICADGVGGTTPSGCSTAGNCEAPPAGGACCHADGTCTDEPDQATCEGASGVFQGGGSTCATTICPSPNDDCGNATVIGEVAGLAFSTTPATNDGGGTCMTSPNLWYEYVPTCTGEAHVSLCGSGYDTKLAGYDGAACSPLGTEIGCNDDSPCSGRALQSELWFSVTQGSSYLLEVGGYSSSTGDGVLTITCTGEAPPVPTVSEWGLVFLTLVGLIVAVIVLRRLRAVEVVA